LRARLRPEPLEERSLLALAAFSINLYRDAGGTPGELIADDTVAAGESFFVEITAQDLRAEPTGLGGIALDLGWNAAALSVVDAPFIADDVLTSRLPALRGGTLDSLAGTIDNLRAASDSSRQVVGQDAAERFALLHFQALAPMVDAPLRIRQGVSQIAFRSPVRTTWRDFEFERQTITVVDASPAPPAAAAPDVVEAETFDLGRALYVELTVAPGSTPQTITRQTLNQFAGAGIERPHVLLTRVQVEVHDNVFDLPLVVSPLEDDLVLPSGTRRIGLAYSTGAIDAVFDTTPLEELAPRAEVDETLIQALASGLAALGRADDAHDPFTIHFR
jgi:hypothetical protein